MLNAITKGMDNRRDSLLYYPCKRHLRVNVRQLQALGVYLIKNHTSETTQPRSQWFSVSCNCLPVPKVSAKRPRNWVRDTRMVVGGTWFIVILVSSQVLVLKWRFADHVIKRNGGPWHTLVTCHLDDWKHQGGVLCNQAISHVKLCRIQSTALCCYRHYPRCWLN